MLSFLRTAVRRGVMNAVPRTSRALHQSPWPPNNNVTPLESVVGFGAFFAVLMIPSSWIMINIKHYRGD